MQAKLPTSQFVFYTSVIEMKIHMMLSLQNLFYKTRSVPLKAHPFVS